MTAGQSRWDEPLAPARYAASKVPLITAYFWIVKLLTTAMGETASDYMVRTINPVIAVLFGFAGFVVAIVLQFRAGRYVPWVYWLAVAMVAVFGTQAADVLHIKFHVPYAASTAFYAVVLVVIFILWYRSEGTLSIHSIRTPRRELFYWATVLATFALGTATGDLTARTLRLGYLASGIWFTLAFAAVAVAHWKFRLNPILAFWIAYVLTRPVGASYADFVAFPGSVGGLNAGHGPVALALAILIAIFVVYLTRTRIDVENPRQAALAQVPSRHRRGEPWQPGYLDGRGGPRQPGYPDGRGRPRQPGYPDGRGRPRQPGYPDDRRPRGDRPPPRKPYPGGWPPEPARDVWPPRDPAGTRAPRDPSRDGWPPREARPRRDAPRDRRSPRGDWPPRDPHREQWPPGDPSWGPRPRRKPPREPWPEARPRRGYRRTEEEAEAEQTAEGFFVWDDP